jgi:hypothetical protein
VGLTTRNRKTVAAVTRVLVPDEPAMVDEVWTELTSYPPRAQRRFRWLFFATEYFPLLSGFRRRFRGLTPEQQAKFLEGCKTPLKRLVVQFLKQQVYSTYISQPSAEAIVGYDGGCLRTTTHE